MNVKDYRSQVETERGAAGSRGDASFAPAARVAQEGCECRRIIIRRCPPADTVQRQLEPDP